MTIDYSQFDSIPAGILCDEHIAQYVTQAKMLDPFVSTVIRRKNGISCLSYGLEGYGYTMRLAPMLKLYRPGKNINCNNPKKSESVDYSELKLFRSGLWGEYALIPPYCSVLGVSVEYFHMPPDVLGVVYGKSTYARAGISIDVTPLENGWAGNLVIEIYNRFPVDNMVFIGEGIGQVVFYKGAKKSGSVYDKTRKYYGQTGVTLAKNDDY